MKHLRNFSISNNNIVSLKNVSFGRFKSLVYLNLAKNRINFIEKYAFTNLTRLAELYMRKNEICLDNITISSSQFNSYIKYNETDCDFKFEFHTKTTTTTTTSTTTSTTSTTSTSTTTTSTTKTITTTKTDTTSDAIKNATRYINTFFF